MRAAASTLVALWLAIACGPPSTDRAEDATGGVSPVASRGPAGEIPTQELAAPASGLERGQVALEIVGDRITLRSRAARRFDVLRTLGEALDFQVIVGEIEEKRRLTLAIESEPLESVLAQILAGVPYALRFDEVSALTWVEIGTFANTNVRERRRDRVEANRDIPPEERKENAKRRDEERERRKAEAARERQERAEAAIYEIADSDPEIRAGAVRYLDTDGESFERLQDLVANDPDPLVRGAAAERLGDADSAGAVMALLAALDDPHPQVVIEALDALEFVGDETLIPKISPLLGHPDPEVREAAAGAIDFLE